MLCPQTLFKNKIQSWCKTTEPMIGCLDTRGSMNTFHRYLLHNEQRRLIVMGQHLPSTACNQQGIPLCGSHEMKVGSA